MKTVLITGCSSGFGLETARYFLDRDWQVIATMRTPREDAMPRLVPANDDNHDAAIVPPFTWVDGHNGLDCQRWGDKVRRKMVAGQ